MHPNQPLAPLSRSRETATFFALSPFRRIRFQFQPHNVFLSPIFSNQSFDSAQWSNRLPNFSPTKPDPPSLSAASIWQLRGGDCTRRVLSKVWCGKAMEAVVEERVRESEGVGELTCVMNLVDRRWRRPRGWERLPISYSASLKRGLSLCYLLWGRLLTNLSL